jgi:pyruvate-formate lyase-activating enzyme
MKVSFDFDGTLSRKDIQEFTKFLVKEGHEVWIVTSRFDDKTATERAWWWIKDQNESLFKVAKECAINKNNIVFTCSETKIKFLEGRGFDFHLDDDDIELLDI